MNFSSKYKDETIYLAYDFSKRLDALETITSAVFTNISVGGLDPAASAMISGNAIIVSGVVKSMILNGVPGCTYQLVAKVNTSTGRILEAKSNYCVI